LKIEVGFYQTWDTAIILKFWGSCKNTNKTTTPLRKALQKLIRIKEFSAEKY
jgi:hypothetical protein